MEDVACRSILYFASLFAVQQKLTHPQELQYEVNPTRLLVNLLNCRRFFQARGPQHIEADRRGPWRHDQSGEPHNGRGTHRGTARPRRTLCCALARDMMAAQDPTIHASAVLVGAKAALIRGPAGAGKSRLVWDLVTAAAQGALPFARLVADDRAHVENRAGRLLVRPAQPLAGIIEIHGLGIRRIAFEPIAAVGLIVDLAADDAARHPEAKATTAQIAGITLPRLAVAAGMAALPVVLARLRTLPAGD